MEPAEWHKSTWVNMNKHDQCFFWTSLQIQKPSRLSLFLSLFCKVLLPLLSFHIFATISLDFLVWATSCHILPRHATTGPLLAGWVSIKWRGLTPHLHHNTVALWERGIGAAGVIRSHLSSHSSANFYFLYYPFTTLTISLASWFGQLLPDLGTTGPLLALFCKVLLQHSAILSHLCYHPSWLLGLGNLLPHLATTCHDWALAGRVSLYKMEGSNPPPAP